MLTAAQREQLAAIGPNPYNRLVADASHLQKTVAVTEPSMPMVASAPP